MYNFREIAVNTLSLSRLMNDRSPIKTQDIVGTELTITEFDFVSVNESTYPVILFKEFPNHYYNGGALLTKLCRAWSEEFDGDVELTSKELFDQGGVKVKFREEKTRDGKNIVLIDII